jgi:hypothetical protein
MSAWRDRPADEAALFNPAYCALLLTETTREFVHETGQGMPFIFAFLPLPILLNDLIRDDLPRSIAAGMHVWLAERPEVVVQIASTAPSLVDVTREAILFGAANGLIAIAKSRLLAPHKTKSPKLPADATEAIDSSFKRARFLGRWLGRAGEPKTVLAMWGIMP